MRSATRRCSRSGRARKPSSPQRCELAPAVGVGLETLALDPHNAETLPARRAHDDPTFEPLVDRRTKLLETFHLGSNVVGFDIDVHAAFVADALDLDTDLAGPILEHHVVAARPRMTWIDW